MLYQQSLKIRKCGMTYLFITAVRIRLTLGNNVIGYTVTAVTELQPLQPCNTCNACNCNYTYITLCSFVARILKEITTIGGGYGQLVTTIILHR